MNGVFQASEVSRQCEFQQQVLETSMSSMQQVLTSFTTDMTALAAMLTQQVGLDSIVIHVNS